MDKWWEWVFSGVGVVVVGWIANVVFKARTHLVIKHVALFPNGNPNRDNELWQLSFEATIANSGAGEGILREVVASVTKDGCNVEKVPITSGARLVASNEGQVLPFCVPRASTIVVYGAHSIGMRSRDMAALAASPTPWEIELVFDFGPFSKIAVQVSTDQTIWP
jgi:hypothetical protein